MTTDWIAQLQKAVERVDVFEVDVEMYDGPDPKVCLCCRFNRATEELHHIIADLRMAEQAERAEAAQ